jgi:hypothetical protein
MQASQVQVPTGAGCIAATNARLAFWERFLAESQNFELQYTIFLLWSLLWSGPRF